MQLSRPYEMNLRLYLSNAKYYASATDQQNLLS